MVSVEAGEVGSFMHALWPPVIWLHAISDLTLAIAYTVIATALVRMARKVRGLRFRRMYLTFGIFIVACAGVHLALVLTFWSPMSWVSGAIKIVCAITSLGAATILVPLVPKAVAVARAANAARARGVQLETAYAELGLLYERTRALEQAKTRFFANVSHELRTPLALILGRLDKWLALGTLPADLRSDLAGIQRNARLLLKYVNELLDIAKLDAAKLSPAYADIDLSELVRLTCSHFAPLARERRIAYTVGAPTSVHAQVDAEMVERVLLNLLSNAFKFAPDGGEVRCGITATAGWTSIHVDDSGPGVSLELRQTIFERFGHAGDSLPKRLAGSGLGLAIAKELVELHAGRIRVDDAPGGGARFVVDLPLQATLGTPVRSRTEVGSTVERAQQAIADIEAARSRADTAAVASAPDRPLVLIVEDNPEMSRFLADALAPEYRVAVAQDGLAGLDRAKELRPDLILSDVMMPRMGGDRMLREIRRDPDLDGTPIVMLTAKADDALRVQLLRAGAQDYVLKPCSIDELRARVANHAAIKRARDHLKGELRAKTGNIETLAKEITATKRELEQALEAARTARAQAERASQIKSNFLSLISHEMRAPANTLQLQMELLRMRGAPATDPDVFYRKVAAAATRLVRLVGSMLDYANLQSGGVPTFVERIDVGALVSEVAAELRPSADEKGLDLRLSVAPDLPPLRSDRHLLRLVLASLADNAVKYTERGWVEISARQDRGEHVLAVRDTGPGIPADRQAAIFEAFEQLAPIAKKHMPGVGLGLALAREVVRLLGGRIEVASRPGEGSEFRVVLPEAAESPPDSARSAA